MVMQNILSKQLWKRPRLYTWKGPNNVIFTVAQALFDETLFPKCPEMHRPGYTPVADPPVGQQGEYNIPPENDENEDYRGAPPLPQIPRGMLGVPHTPVNRGAPPPRSESSNSSPPENQETLPESSGSDFECSPSVERVPRHHRTSRNSSESSRFTLIRRLKPDDTPRQPRFKRPMPTRRLGRRRVLAIWPDNVYRDRAPVNILDEDDDTFLALVVTKGLVPQDHMLRNWVYRLTCFRLILQPK